MERFGQCDMCGHLFANKSMDALIDAMHAIEGLRERRLEVIFLSDKWARRFHRNVALQEPHTDVIDEE